MGENVSSIKNEIKDKIIVPKGGAAMLILVIFLFIGSLILGIVSIINLENGKISTTLGVVLIVAAGLILFVLAPILCSGIKILSPNDALVLTLFGKYHGTIATEGISFVNPFCTSVNPSAGVNVPKKISIKAMTLNNDKQKVNDLDGNPIEIGVIVIWKIVDAAKAVFNVENYQRFVSIQSDSAIRHVARSYPYDVSTEGDEQSLRGSSTEIADVLKNELQSRTTMAGIEIIEAKISHLAYAPEIAAAMLQRQQASAVIAARQMIVEGAVGMVEMALNKLSENNVVELDDERKAQMVSNLLVVLCGNKDAQPIVNSGSIF